MKFTLTFKTPNIVDSAIDPYTDTHCDQCEDHNEECDACLDIEDDFCTKIREIILCTEKFIRYNECITIEFDTETQTATVISK